MSRSPRTARRSGPARGLFRLLIGALLVLQTAAPVGLLGSWRTAAQGLRAARELASQDADPVEDPSPAEEGGSEGFPDLDAFHTFRSHRSWTQARHAPPGGPGRSRLCPNRREDGPGHFLDAGRALRRWLGSDRC